MKKIYTLIALAFAAMSASADVVLTFGGKEVNEELPLEVLAEEENFGDETDPYIMIECGAKDPQVKNNGSSAANFTVTVETDDYKNFTWCGITDQCMPMPSSTESRSSSLKGGESTNLVLDAVFGGYDEDYNPIWGPAAYATYTAKVSITSGSKTHTYTLNFVYDQRSSCGVLPGGEAGINTVLRGQDNAPRYDLQGRRTNSTANGLFIQNGRKYILK